MMQPDQMVTLVILAKDKGHVLPAYLQAVENQTYPKEQIKLYIRTNNNRDNTQQVLEDWIARAGSQYNEIHYDASDVAERVQDYSPHDWNTLKLDVLKRIRQDSIDWAVARGTHYFVVDCDNFIIPQTLERMLATGLPVVGPFLKNVDNPASFYSNYHHMADENGYFKSSHHYYDIFNRHTRGLVEVDVIHCTYLIRREVLPHARYEDGTRRFEYVIFSDTLRKLGIPQYLDNRIQYGWLTFCDTAEAFAAKNMILPDGFAPK